MQMIKVYRRERGFTLVELILVVVLLGIISTASFAYLRFSGQILSDTVQRDQITSDSRFFIQRLTRELEAAIPASVRVSSNGQCIEFVPIAASGLYVKAPLPGAIDDEFVVSLHERYDINALQGGYVFIYANSSARIYDNSNAYGNRRIISAQPASESGLYQFELSGDAFTRASPSRRFYSGDSPVSWCQLNNNSIARFQNYGWSRDQVTWGVSGSCQTPCSQSKMMESMATGERPLFQVAPPGLQRNALVQVNLTAVSAVNDERIMLSHDIHIPNVP